MQRPGGKESKRVRPGAQRGLSSRSQAGKRGPEKGSQGDLGSICGVNQAPLGRPVCRGGAGSPPALLTLHEHDGCFKDEPSTLGAIL